MALGGLDKVIRVYSCFIEQVDGKGNFDESLNPTGAFVKVNSFFDEILKLDMNSWINQIC